MDDFAAGLQDNDDYQSYQESLIAEGFFSREQLGSSAVQNEIAGKFKQQQAIKETDPKSSFVNFVQPMVDSGEIDEASFDSPATKKVLVKAFEDAHEGSLGGKVKSAALSEAGSITDIYREREEIRRQRDNDEADGAFEFSVDQAQKQVGEFLRTVGDAVTNSTMFDSGFFGEARNIGESIFGEDDDPNEAQRWLGDVIHDVGKNIVDQQEEDIKEGNYRPVYKGGFFEQDNVADMGGWILEGLASNSVSAGVSLGGAAAAAATAPFSLTAAAAIGGATTVGTVALATGSVADELREKGVYDEDHASGYLAVGIVSGVVDKLAMSSIIPKSLLIKKMAQDGTIDKLKTEIVKSGFIKEATSGVFKGFAKEGFTEVIQEGLTIATAAAEGAEYDEKEILNRFGDAFILGGVMGAGAGTATSAAARIRDRGETPTKHKVAQEVEAERKEQQDIIDQLTRTDGDVESAELSRSLESGEIKQPDSTATAEAQPEQQTETTEQSNSGSDALDSDSQKSTENTQEPTVEANQETDIVEESDSTIEPEDEVITSDDLFDAPQFEGDAVTADSNQELTDDDFVDYAGTEETVADTTQETEVEPEADDFGGNGPTDPPSSNTASQPTPNNDDQIDHAASAIYKPDPESKGKVRQFLHDWMRTAVHKFGAENQNAAEKVSAVNNSSTYIVNKVNKQIKKLKTKLTDSDNAQLKAYMSARVNQRGTLEREMSPEVIAVGKAMRTEEDKLSKKIIEQNLIDLSRRTGYNLTLDDVKQGRVEVEPETTTEDGKVIPAVIIDLEKDFPASFYSIRTMSENIGSHVTRSYEIHTNKLYSEKISTSNEPEFVKRREDAMREYFIPKARAKYPDMSTPDMEEKAKQMRIDYIESNSPKKGIFQDGATKKREGLLKSRSETLDNNPTLRALLGEFQDPIESFVHSIHRKNTLYATKEFYNTIIDNGNIQVYQNQDEAQGLEQIQLPKNDVFDNPFSGMYADKNTARFLRLAFGDGVLSEKISLMVQANGLWQLTTVPLSAPTSAANLLSTIPVVLATASFNPSVMKDTFKSIGHVFMNNELDADTSGRFKETYGITPEQAMDEMIRNDIFSGGAMEGELANYAKEAGGFKAFARLLDIDSKRIDQVAVKKTAQGAKSGLDFALKVYGVGDSLPKAAIYLNHRKKLMELKREFGDAVTPNSDDNASANISKQSSPQYTRLVDAVKALRETPLTGQFVAFKAQLYQTVYNQARINLAYMAPNRNKDFLNKHANIDIDGARSEAEKARLISKLRKYGAVKQASQMATFFGYSATIGLGLSAAFGDGDEPDQDEMDAINVSMPEYYRFNDKAYAGRDEEGNAQFINTARLNMYGDLGALVKIPFAYMDGDITEASEVAKLMADNMAAPFIAPTFITRTVTDLVKNEDQYNKAIIVSEDGLVENAVNVASYLSSQFTSNGTIKAASEIYNSLDAEHEFDERKGNEFSAKKGVMALGGMSLIGFDPKKQVVTNLKTFKFEENALRTRLGGHLKSFQDMDEYALEDTLIKTRAEHNAIHKQMLLRIDAARRMGVDDQTIFEGAKLAGISKGNMTKYLLRGEIPPFKLGNIGKSARKEMVFRNLSDSAKTNFLGNYKKAQEVLNNLPYDDDF